MIRTIRCILPLLLALLITAGCSTTQPTVNPRTMTFEPLTFNIPKSQKLVLKNGMTIYLLEDHELQLVNITAYVNTGSIYEPPEKAGLAGLTGAVMRSGGTKDIPPEKLDEELEFMASGIESGIGADVGNVSLSTLTKNLDRTLELFAQVMTKPAFREERVTLAKNRTIEGIRRQNDNPKSVADRELRKVLYAGHTLGRYPTIENIKNIGREDMIAFHNRYFRPDRIMLAVAGDVNASELVITLERLFLNGWEKSTGPLPSVEPPTGEFRPMVLFVRKDTNQSVIRMGHPGVEKSNPDIYAIRVMDYILGGGFTSRLTTEIRSNQGLAYNVDSHFDIGRRFIGTFIAETETKSESTGKAITLIKQLIADLTREPVTDQELELAKNSIINGFIFGFAKSDSVVNQQARLDYYGYPEGYLEKYRDNIAKVTKEDILRVARKYLHPNALTISVVGNDKAFDKPLSTFGTVNEIKLEPYEREKNKK